MKSAVTLNGKKVTVLDVLGQGGAFARSFAKSGGRPYEDRPQQMSVARAFERGIAVRRHVIAQAATGCGKSHAALVPASLSGEKIVYSTAVKALQEQIEEKDAPTIAAIFEEAFGRQVTYAVLKGRGNYVCLRNVERLEKSDAFRSDEAAKAFPSLLDWIEQERYDDGVADVETFPGSLPIDLRMDIVTGTDECTGEKCPLFSKCFGEKAKNRADKADIVITNHKLTLMDAMIRSSSESFASVLPDYSVLILDECHQFEDIARDTFGVEITEGRGKRLVSIMDRLTVLHDEIIKEKTPNEKTENAFKWSHRMAITMKAFEAYLLDLKARLENRDDDAREIRLGDERPVLLGADPLPGIEDTRPNVAAVVDLIIQTGLDLEENLPTYLNGEENDQWLKAAAQTIKLGQDLQTIITPGTDNTWVRRAKLDGDNGKTKIILEAKPINVAPMLRESFFNGTKKVKWMRAKGGAIVPTSSLPPLVVLAMSATISVNSSMAMFRERVGCDSAEEVIVGSPFDFEKNALLYLPDSAHELVPVTRNKPGYNEYMSALAAEMRGLTLDAQGGAFLLFTSRSAMNEIYNRIAGDLEAAGLLVLRQGDANRNTLVAQFKAHGNAVLFGLKTFWEGVDIAGNALRLVAIDKIPFNPPSDILWSALCQYIDRQHPEERMASFSRLILPHAIITLMQGVGRLIRTQNDMGVFAILDGRVRTKSRGYGDQILDNMPPASITSSPRVVHGMFDAMRSGRQFTPAYRRPVHQAAPAPSFQAEPVATDQPALRVQFRRLSRTAR
jgi:Rad3-related DNA helicase